MRSVLLSWPAGSVEDDSSGALLVCTLSRDRLIGVTSKGILSPGNLGGTTGREVSLPLQGSTTILLPSGRALTSAVSFASNLANCFVWRPLLNRREAVLVHFGNGSPFCFNMARLANPGGKTNL
jgi:hypothetical protein